MAKDTKISEGDNDDNETINRLHGKKLNGPIGYLTFLHSDVDSVSFKKR